MIIVEYTTLGLKPTKKQIELPHNIHLEFCGWYSDRDIYLWWLDQFSAHKCKKIISTKWKINLEKAKEGFKILNSNENNQNKHEHFYMGEYLSDPHPICIICGQIKI